MSDALKPDDESPRSPHHVLDELKSVLSNLGQHAEPAAPDVLPASAFSPTEPPPAKQKISSMPPPPPSAPAASDADFWSGNVLGWPSGTEEMKRDATPNPMPISPPSMVPPTPAFAPPPPPIIPTEVVQKPPNSNDVPIWSTETVLPEAPTAPRSPATLNANSTSSGFVDDTPPPVEQSEPAAALRSDSLLIPREAHDPRPSPPFEMMENPVLQAEAVAKPKDLIQLACFFPEGSDKIGQQFAKQLRDAGAQRVPSLVIEPVLISSWSSGNIDMNAWTKSAQLSGADIMFILAPRQELKNFQSNPPSGFYTQIATRIVAMEHVALRTLYADIIIELKRNA